MLQLAQLDDAAAESGESAAAAVLKSIRAALAVSSKANDQICRTDILRCAHVTSYIHALVGIVV